MTGAACIADMHINPQPILNILEKFKVSHSFSQWARSHSGYASVQACEQCGQAVRLSSACRHGPKHIALLLCKTRSALPC